MPQIFLIGATGHVGGAILDQVLGEFPDVTVKALVQSEAESARLVAKWPSVGRVIDEAKSSEKLEAAARGADIVINAAPEAMHEDDVRIMLHGMRSRGDTHKCYYIHTSSGASSVAWDLDHDDDDDASGRPRNAPRIWDDVADIDEIVSMESTGGNADMDKIVRTAWPEVNIAIVAPGAVGGISPAISQPVPPFLQDLLLTARRCRAGVPRPQADENGLGWIDVRDLARMYLLLVTEALDALESGQSAHPEAWGPEAYYFGAAEDVSLSEFVQGLVPLLHEHGILEKKKVGSPSVTGVTRDGTGPRPEVSPPKSRDGPMHLAIWYGINMRIRSSRMQSMGWQPKERPIMDSLEEVVSETVRVATKL